MYVVYHTLDAQYRFLSYKFDGGAFERICIPHCDIVQRDGVCACLNMNSDGIEDLSINPVACMGLALHILVKYHYPVSFKDQELMNEFMIAPSNPFGQPAAKLSRQCREHPGGAVRCL